MSALVSDAARQKSRPPNTEEHIGKTYGMLTVLARAQVSRNGVHWKCQCKCGKARVSRASHVISGHTQSCGCLTATTVSNRRWTGHGEISGTYWSDLKANAIVRDIPVEIGIEQAWDLFLYQNRCCALSGLRLSFSRDLRKKGRHGQTASLDRINSDKGYLHSNVQWVHKDLNVMKMDMPDSTFIGWCMTISHHAETSGLLKFARGSDLPHTNSAGIDALIQTVRSHAD